MRRDLVIAALALIALVAVSLLGRQTEPPVGATRASDDYGFGGYRAWYDLLAREGIRVETWRRHHDALRDSGIDTLVVSFPADGVGYDWNAGERDALRAWVRGGGRMVDVGLTPYSGKDDDSGEKVYLDDTKGDKGALRGSWASNVAALPNRGTDRLFPEKKANVETLLRDRAGILAVRYRYGRGEVIGVANGALFENRAIARGDAARLAYLAARPGRPGGAVAFDEAIRGDVVDKPWYRALTAPELVALALAALAGLLWLAYGIVPLGPPVRLFAPREPTSAEFVGAIAALYERVHARDHAADALLRDARRSLERAARTPETVALQKQVRFLEMESLSDDAALIAVAQLSRTAREEIVRATSPDRRFAPPAGGIGARRRRR
ncbi:MAG TPA: DUF4350 domain-containing protein [Candidatus Limnocylindrales bacterium]|nr:DUF4350 domain-containing protein [Candidatus Limnocylindrales bacterium]